MSDVILTDPLEWEAYDDDLIRAATPFGNYYVKKWSSVTFEWSYIFDEYYDEDQGTKITLEEAKCVCQKDWDGRVKPILERWVKAHG